MTAEADHPVLLHVVYRMRTVVPRLEEMLGQAWRAQVRGDDAAPTVRTSICTYCGATYRPGRQNQKLCSAQCRKRAHFERKTGRRPHVCLTCGDMFLRKKFAHRKAYCSTRCKNRAKQVRVASKPLTDDARERRNAWARDKYWEHREATRCESRSCEVCGRAMVRPTSRKRFCSTRCRNSHHARLGAIAPKMRCAQRS